MTASRHFRILWAVFLTVVGTLCVPGGAAASTGRVRACEMLGKGCCVTRPSSGCCCETKKPLRPSAPAMATVDGQPAPGSAWELVETHRTGRCPCGFSDPATPGPKSRPNSVESEIDSVTTRPLEAFFISERPDPGFGRYASSRGSPARTPLYLRNSRLLI